MSSDRFLLSPFFIDSPLSDLARASGRDWEHLDPPPLPDAPQMQRLAALYQPIAGWVAKTAAAGDRPVSIAGDCCTTVPMLAGLQRAGIAPLLIWFDAHGDFNTWETTPSGFLGGMPLAWLVGRGEQTVPEAVGLRPIPEADVILTDARDLDPGEREAVAESEVTHLGSVLDLLRPDVQEGRKGLGRIQPRPGKPDGRPGTGRNDPPPPAGLAMRRNPARPIWVHFDTDVLRPEDAPAQNYLAAGGPAAAELGAVFDAIRATGRLRAVSVSAWNPAMDPDRKTERVVMTLLDRLLQPGND